MRMPRPILDESLIHPAIREKVARRRSALKLWTVWQTFPMVFVKGVLIRTFLTFLALALGAQAHAQSPQDPRTLVAAQKEAMAPLDYMHGIWRGPATTVLPNGEKHSITQTERIGPFLGGTLKVIEGRGYEASGEVSFNAFGIISYDPAKKAYNFRSYAMGRSGDFPLTVKPDGYVWEIPQPTGKIIYTAVVKDNVWHEVGDRVLPDRDPVRFFEMKLQRVGDTDWPLGTPVAPK